MREGLAVRRFHVSSSAVSRSGSEPGLGADVVEDPVDQSVLEDEPRVACRLLDRALELVGAHRADEETGLAEQVGEGGVLGAAAVVVGADRGDHAHRRVGIARSVHQHVEVAIAFLGVAADGEHLFQLVDHDHERRVAVARCRWPPAPRTTTAIRDPRAADR